MSKVQSTSESIQAFTKIQESQQANVSTLLNKQVGYFVHVQTDKVYKIKNCIDSEKSNSQLYKKFSKDFIGNIKKGQDQMILCCGLEQISRMQTSIGCKKNPGLFLIAGIGVLDEKYQQDFTKLDIQISFLEYNDGKLYDLLSYTQVPLKMIKKQENIFFGQTFCKVSTFNQFLKLFKIALFNNKQRDIRIQNSQSDSNNSQRIKSSLIMTIVTKKYVPFAKNNTKVQRSIIIDFAGSRPSTGQETGNQKNIWDYFMIQLNNLTPKKKLHYHLVQPNPLLSLTKSILKNGHSFIIPSFSTNPQVFPQNYKYFSQIYDIVDSIPQLQNPTQNQTSSMNSTTKEKADIFLQKNQNQAQMLQIIQQALENLASQIKSKKYQSLRQYRELKHKNLVVIRNCLEWSQSYRKVFTRLFENKRRIKLYQNQIIGDQIKLIGVCVKSDHYKDFYEAKSYLSLQRQIGIKTQTYRQKIGQLIKSRYEIKQKFSQLRAKHGQYIQTIQSSNAFQIKNLATKILQFISKTFYNILFFQQRTVIDEVLKQENVSQNMIAMGKKLLKLQNQICQMGKKGSILFESNDFRKDAHLSLLVNEVQNLINKQESKIRSKLYKIKQSSQKQNNSSKLAKEGEREKVNLSVGKFTKLPVISEKKINFQICGRLSLSSLLLNPSQQI